jgi:hypothetical protein
MDASWVQCGNAFVEIEVGQRKISFGSFRQQNVRDLGYLLRKRMLFPKYSVTMLVAALP